MTTPLNPLGTRASTLTERLAEVTEKASTAIEEAGVLDAPAKVLGRLAALIPTGPVKDLLSGTAAGHPIHPALVTVPIGAFCGTLYLDLVGASPDASRRLLGFGIASAVPTAAAGLSDWGDTEGAERRVGVAHALANSLGLGLMAASWVQRRGGGSGRASALAGLGLVGLGGWLGGHLAYALGVGVDTTAFQQPPTQWTDACAEAEVKDGSPYVVHVADTAVLLVREDGTIRALDNRCSHRGGPLDEGTLDDGCVECPWHGSRFRLADGAVVRGPATRPARSYETRVVDGRVQLRRKEIRTLRTNPAS